MWPTFPPSIWAPTMADVVRPPPGLEELRVTAPKQPQSAEQRHSSKPRRRSIAPKCEPMQLPMPAECKILESTSSSSTVTPVPTETMAEQDEEMEDTDDGSESELNEEEDLALFISMEGAQTTQSVEACLEVACKAVGRLGPETSVAILHLIARRGLQQPADPVLDKLTVLLRHLRKQLPRIRRTRTLAKLAWALGKLEVKLPEVDAALLHLCTVSIDLLSKFTPQDLTNSLWAFAKLMPGVRGHKSALADAVSKTADAIVMVCVGRIGVLTAQCLTNSLWATARLGLRGYHVEAFLGSILRELTTERHLSVFTSQGLANALWAVAELRSNGVYARFAAGLEGPRDCRDRQGDENELMAVLKLCVALAHEGSKRVPEFQSQELSMMAWAYAKLLGRVGATVPVKKVQRRSPGPVGSGGQEVTEASCLADVTTFLLSAAGECTKRVHEMSPQSISNVAWALATLDLLKMKDMLAPARNFMLTTLKATEQHLEQYPPQAVANILWAAVRLDVGKGTMKEQLQRFAAAVAKVTTLRMLEFTWRDLAGIAVSLAHRQLQPAPEFVTFTTLLVCSASGRCNELTPQLMLNIAQSASRLGVSPDTMQGMADAIARSISERGLRLNEVDRRQWGEVLSRCPRSPQTDHIPAQSPQPTSTW